MRTGFEEKVNFRRKKEYKPEAAEQRLPLRGSWLGEAETEEGR